MGLRVYRFLGFWVYGCWVYDLENGKSLWPDGWWVQPFRRWESPLITKYGSSEVRPGQLPPVTTPFFNFKFPPFFIFKKKKKKTTIHYFTYVFRDWETQSHTALYNKTNLSLYRGVEFGNLFSPPTTPLYPPLDALLTERCMIIGTMNVEVVNSIVHWVDCIYFEI